MTARMRTYRIGDDGRAMAKRTKVDKIADFTKDIAEGRINVDKHNQKKVFVTVAKTKKVHCWPYNRFRKFNGSTHGMLVRFPTQSELNAIPRGSIPSDMRKEEIDVPLNAAHDFLFDTTDYIVRSFKTARKGFRKAKAKQEAAKVSASPKKIAKKKK